MDKTNSIAIWAVILAVYIFIVFRKRILNIFEKLSQPKSELERWYKEELKRQSKAKAEYYYQKFSKLKDKHSHKNIIRFRSTTEAFLFACENSAPLEINQPLVGIVRDISTSRYMFDITKFAPVYEIEIALNTGPFKTTVRSPVIDYHLEVGSLVLWIPMGLQNTECPSGVLQSEIYPILSLQTGWKLKKAFI
ncbi:hypothetical protein A9G11_03535 [Gilliamella sp. wkB108]|uniref:hypothetical protein n=1 Tax=Gilliamella sp. wkB108 TaxID=3120256 RepID=UPI00080E074B|nr:hypothetical protein [Gilliamella apicola]OCG24739.1 hypothetical protein A9G11_03535 [Gilliamella apicola]